MRDLRLGFTDTYTNCINFFTDILGRRYNVIRDDQDPDYLIFGDANFGTNHLNYTRPHKIFFTGENVRPNYSECDVALTFDHENSPRHYRLPLYVLEMWAINKDNNVHGKFDYLYLTHRDIDYEKEWDQKTNFSAYVQSNPYCQQRNLFVMMLLDAGLLASSGPHLNTTGIILPRDRTLKLDFFHQAKFGIAMENGAHPGYVTEKLIDCYYANTVPIYWGSDTVDRDFNPKSMVKVYDIPTIDYLIEIGNNKSKYLDILYQPPFNNNIAPDVTNLDNFLDWWDMFVFEEQHP